ncbi:MAG: allantoinase AllB [Desulfurococcaceae archaeon]
MREGGVLVRGGTLLLPQGMVEADVKVVEGKVAAIGRGLDPSGVEEVIDARGLLVMPGAVDEHVHMREPGLEYKDDFDHGTLAAALGGVTTVIDHPNTLPPVDSAERLRQKASLLGPKARVDFALLGVLHDGNVDRFGEILEAGAAGFKVFLGPTTGNIPPPSDANLYRIMELSAKHGTTIAFHAEDNSIVALFTERVRSSGRTDPEAHADARPPLAEELAIAKIGLFARRTGGRALVVHVSSSEALEAIERERANGTRIYAETCPHYLVLDVEDYRRYGPLIKVNPPIRGGDHRRRLLRALAEGRIDTLGSDHAPHAPHEKEGDVWSAAAGMPGVQTLLPIALDLALGGAMPLEELPRLLSENPARLFGLYPMKGAIQVGSDGDLVVVDPRGETVVTADWLAYKHKLSPYIGRRLRGRIVHVILRGNVIVRDGKYVGQPVGRFVAGRRTR